MSAPAIRCAYADPPYPGKSKRHYGEHPDYAGEVDHEQLIAGLERDYPDGWALSTNACSLQEILEFCPRPERTRRGEVVAGSGVRVCVWARPNAHPTSNHRVIASWEPVIVRGGRWRHAIGEPYTRDYYVAPHLGGFMGGEITGQKPDGFSVWVFHLLGLRAGDELHDIFAGSGAVGRAWSRFAAQADLYSVSRAGLEQLALEPVVVAGN